MTSIPLVVTHPCALVREALDRILMKSQFPPVHIVPTPDETVESHLGSLGNCIWLIGVKACSSATNDVVRRVVTANPSIKPVILAASHTSKDVMLALDAGAFGFLCQNMPSEQLIKSLELVALGQTVIHPHSHLMALAQMAARTHPTRSATAFFELPATETPNDLDEHPHLVRSLSRRELVILRTLTEGASNKIIARKLVITESTVKVHMKAILRKLRLQNRTQAAIWARTHLRELAPPYSAVTSDVAP
jgi:two-component system nitrate/nitrite response regulator NarL